MNKTTIFLIAGLLMIIAGILLLNSSKNSSDLLAVYASPTIIFLGGMMLFVWFLEFFKNPRK